VVSRIERDRKIRGKIVLGDVGVHREREKD
jgi:hypothetical protein